MIVVVRVVAGLVLLAHGLVHLLYLRDDVPEFSLERAWVPEEARRPLGLALTAATVAGFALLALAVWRVPGLVSLWPAIAIVACLMSFVLLGVFWNPHLVFGVVIDVAVLAAALTRPDWIERVLG